MREREIDAQRRAVASGGALTPGDVEVMDADAEADREAEGVTSNPEGLCVVERWAAVIRGGISVGRRVRIGGT